MDRRLRAFISSTMKDLRNERSAVVKRLTEFNFAPVNAEGWLPNGKKSWERIEQEIESSNIFVLIIGERYGWIPERGPKADLGLSVTHLEFKAAQALQIPILCFLKKLDYDTDRGSEDAQKRDAFRKEVQDWAQGYFVGEFDLAEELANEVGAAVIALLTDEYLRKQVQRRSPSVTKSTHLLEKLEKPKTTIQLTLPTELIHTVRSQKAVLFAGSGISLAAGLPSAAAFSEKLIQLVRKRDSYYNVNPVGGVFAGVATDLEASGDRGQLINAVLSLIHPPQGIVPTLAHQLAVKLFDYILTTNYDVLFEDALVGQSQQSALIVSEIQGNLPERAIIKLHGSAGTPESLLLTELDVFTFDQTRPLLWQAVVKELREKMVVVIGTSLRDPSIIRLFNEVGKGLHGFFVAPRVWKYTPRRLQPWNLQCIDADADTFMKELAAGIENTG